MDRIILRILFYVFLVTAIATFFVYHFSLLIPLISALIAILIILILLPPRIKEGIPETEPCAFSPIENSEADFVLVLSAGAGKEKNNREFEWLNILEKECGFFGTYKLNNDENFFPQNGRVLIFTAEALNEIASSPVKMPKLLSLVRNGGKTVLLECPDNRFELLTGVLTGPITNIKLSGIRFAGEKEIKNFFPSDLPPFPCRHIISPVENEKIISETDNIPVILRCRSGKGIAVSIFFKLSEWHYLLSQGNPGKWETIKNRFIPFIKLRHIQTHDMGRLTKKRFNPFPFLDIFERLIIKSVAECEKIPVWWYYPSGKTSASILTFDEDYCGDEIADILSIDHLTEFSPAFFLMSATTANINTFNFLKESESETGIHWNRFHFHLTGKGFHKEKNKALSSQIKKLSSRMETIYAKVSRIHYLISDTNPLKTFSILERAGIDIDSSWGPGRNMGGYIFGTGFPYNPLGEDGTPLRIYEIPFQVHEPQGCLTAEEIESMLNMAAEKYYAPVVFLFHPGHCVKNKKAKDKLEWVVDRTLKDERIWKTGLREFTDYFSGRKQSSIFSYRTGKNVKIDVEAKFSQQTLKIQQVNDILELKVDGEAVSPEKYRDNGFVILELGKHLIEIEYK